MATFIGGLVTWATFRQIDDFSMFTGSQTDDIWYILNVIYGNTLAYCYFKLNSVLLAQQTTAICSKQQHIFPFLWEILVGDFPKSFIMTRGIEAIQALYIIIRVSGCHFKQQRWRTDWKHTNDSLSVLVRCSISITEVGERSETWDIVAASSLAVIAHLAGSTTHVSLNNR